VPPDEEPELLPEPLLEPPLELLVVPPELLEEPPELLPPPHGPQTPCELPGAMMHDVPGQQSALLVQPPQAATQDIELHTN
jgi:hypothetical protein